MNVPQQKREINKCMQASWIADDGTLYASSQNSVFKSVDQGVTWKHLKTFSCENIESIFINQDGFIFASPGSATNASDCGLYRSTDAGQTWKKVLHLPLSCSIWSTAEAPSGAIFASVYTKGEAKNARIYRSDDEGFKWNQAFSDKTARHVHHVTVDKETGTIYASVGDKFVPQSNVAYIVRSVDGGYHWQKIFPKIPQIVALEAIPGARLFATDDVCNGQIFRTTDDVVFARVLDTGAHSYGFWIRREPSSGQLLASFVAGEAQKRTAGIYASNDDGVNWSIHHSFEAPLAYDGSTRATNFNRGIIYYSVKIGGARKNGIQYSAGVP